MLRAFDGGRMFGASTGEWPPRVLALPGWGRTHRDFDAVLAGLDALALDPPGFGTSPPPPAVWSPADFAAAVAPVAREARRSLVVVGHSFGGRVATHLAADHPDLVVALVVTGSPLLRTARPPKPSLAYRALRVAHRLHLVRDERIEERRRRTGSADYRAATGVMRDVLVRAVTSTDEDALARVACPVELVWGADDTAAPVAVAERARAILGPERARLTVLDGVDHFVPQRDPDGLRAAIERVLA